MSDTNAAATLSLKIDTGDAAKQLQALETAYDALQRKLAASGAGSAGPTSIGKAAEADTQRLKTLEAEIEALKTKSRSLSHDASKPIVASYSFKFDDGSVANAKKVLKGITNDQLIQQSIQQKLNADQAKFLSQISTPTYVRKEITGRLEDARKSVNERNKLYADEYVSAQTAAKNLLSLQERTREQLKFEQQAQLADAAKAQAAQAAARKAQEQQGAGVVAIQRRADAEAKAERANQAATGSAIVALQSRARAEQEATGQAILAIQRRADAEKAAARKKEETTAQEILAIQRRADAEIKALDRAAALNTRFALGGTSQNPLSQAKARLGIASSAKAFMEQRGEEATITKFGSEAALAAKNLEPFQSAVARLSQTKQSLSQSSKASTQHLVHWNQVANESHAAARGLSGALGGLWMTYGSIAPLLAGAALAGSMKQIFTVGKELEYQFNFVRAISGEATVSMSKFGEAVKGSLQAPVEAAQGLRVLAQAGLNTEQALAALPNVLKLATVGETDMANAALSATSIMHTFGLEVGNIGHIGDVFAKAAAVSATSVKEMMEAMKQASSIANIYGVSIEETGAALATLANRGIEGSAAGTAIRNMLKELASPATEKAAYALQQYGIQIFNADGSAKSLTDNLEQLANVTARMSSETKAKFLEDLFNERGAKAANILLSDLGKMNESLQDIRRSSEGLGFMTEAQIQISQSTTGMVAGLRNELQMVFANVFTEVEPQIKQVLVSIRELVTSEGFKEFFVSLATTVADFSRVLVEHADVVKTVVLAYAGFKILTTVGSAAIVASTAVAGLSTSFGALVAPVLAASGAMGTVAAGATVAGGSLTALAAVLSGPLAIGLGAAAAAYAVYTLSQEATTEEQRKLMNELDGANEAHGRMADSVKSARLALEAENDVLRIQIDLMRQGMSAADAYGQAKKQTSIDDAKATRDKAKAALLAAQGAVDANPVDQAGGQTKEQTANFKLRDNALKNLAAAEKHVEDLATENIRAGMARREQLTLQQQQSDQKRLEGYNSRIEQLKKAAAAAESDLNAPIYGKDQATKDARKKHLQGTVEAWKQAQAAGLDTPFDTSKFDDKSVQDEARRKAAALDALNVKYERKPAKTKGAPGLGVQEEPEQIKLAKELLKTELAEIDTAYANHYLTLEQYTGKRMEAAIREAETEIMAHDSLRQTAVELGNKAEAERQAAAMVTAGQKAMTAVAEEEKKRTQGLQALTIASQEFARSEADSILQMQQDLQWARLSTVEQRKLTEARRIDLEFRNKVQNADGTPKINVGSDEYNQIKRTYDERKRLREEFVQEEWDASRSWAQGWATASKDYYESVTNSATAAADVFRTTTDAMADALTEFVMTGKLEFKDFAQSVIKEIVNIQMKALAAQAVGGSGGLFGGIMGMLGMGGGAATAGPSAVAGGGSWLGAIPSLVTSANGNVFSGSPSLHQYANTVQSSPKMFAFDTLHGFAKGGVFAEAGPEAVMPLTRDSNGRLGVQATGGGGAGNVSVVNNITINKDGGASATSSTEGSGDYEQSKQLTRRIESAVMDVISREKRSGGILA